MQSPTAREASATVKEFAQTTEDRITDTMEQAQALAQERYDTLTAAIRRNPLQAAGIAAGIGFVLALLARR